MDGTIKTRLPTTMRTLMMRKHIMARSITETDRTSSKFRLCQSCKFIPVLIQNRLVTANVGSQQTSE